MPDSLRPISTTFEGQSALLIPSGNGDYVIVSSDGKRVLAQSKGAYYNEGQFGINDQGDWVLSDGTSSQYTDTGIITLEIDNGSLHKAEFQDYEGEVVYDIYGENNSSIRFDSQHGLDNAVVKEALSGSEIIIRNGQYLENRNITNVGALLSQTEPWYQKFALSNTADFTDQKLDQIASYMLGEAQDNMGWVLSATAVNSARDIIKGAITDTLRFGSSLPGALDDFSNAWQDFKDGKPLSAGYKAFLGSGKIFQEFSRATVIIGAVKGLGTSALKAEGASIKEALAAAKATGKKTTVIGHAFDPADTKVALDWPDHNVLNLPKSEWSWPKNKQWIDEAIARGDEIFLATDPSRARANSTFARELEYLRNLGFEQNGAKMIRKR